MNSLLHQKQQWLQIALAGSIIGLTLGLILFTISSIINVKASPPPPLNEKILATKAIAKAQFLGLKGTPQAQRIEQMSLDEWLKKINAGLGTGASEFGFSPELPVFVVAMRGNITWNAPSLPRPGHKNTPEHYDNITIVLNAQTGDLIWYGSYRPGFALPLAVP